MLCLTRHVDQKVTINGNIVVTVLGIKEGTVRLGFEAPKEVPIVRYNAKRKQEQDGQNDDVQEQPDHSGTNAAHGNISRLCNQPTEREGG